MFLPASNIFADNDIEITDVEERASSAFSYFNSGMVFDDDDVEMTDIEERASSAFSYFSFNSDMVFDDDGDVEMGDRSTGSSPPPPLLPPAPVVPNEPELVYDDFDFEAKVTKTGVYLNVTFKNTGTEDPEEKPEELFHVSIHYKGIRTFLKSKRALNRNLFHMTYKNHYYSIKIDRNYRAVGFSEKIDLPVRLLNEYLSENISSRFTECFNIMCIDPIYSAYWLIE